MAYTVYIMCSMKTKGLYVGHSKNVDVRIARHEGAKTKTTREGTPWTLVYLEKFDHRSEALEREVEIRKRGTAKFLRGVAQPG